MLCDLLIENMIKELVKVLLSKLIIEFTSMRLNDIASSRR
jgi:hypothetical protein